MAWSKWHQFVIMCSKYCRIKRRGGGFSLPKWRRLNFLPNFTAFEREKRRSQLFDLKFLEFYPPKIVLWIRWKLNESASASTFKIASSFPLLHECENWNKKKLRSWTLEEPKIIQLPASHFWFPATSFWLLLWPQPWTWEVRNIFSQNFILVRDSHHQRQSHQLLFCKNYL